jgi:hypothetical protein
MHQTRYLTQIFCEKNGSRSSRLTLHLRLEQTFNSLHHIFDGEAELLEQ